jgi:cation diffusion facilitator family transporter
MSDCCGAAACELEKLRHRQSRTLWIVLAINAVMFVVEFGAGLIAGSTALLGDSLDMLGDALVYGFSLYVVARDDGWKARSAFLKSAVMACFGLFVMAEAIHRALQPELPAFTVMGTIGLAAFAANSLCLGLLWRHRAEDVNMRSVWLCSRNDLIANTAVLGAAATVWLLQSHWPDLVVGTAIACLFLRSALHVFRDAAAVRRAHQLAPTSAPASASVTTPGFYDAGHGAGGRP